MTNILTIPVDPARLDAAHAAGKLKQSTWGNGFNTVCMMSALVPGAYSSESCVTAGWPEWLVELNIRMFDGAETIQAAWEFAHSVAIACVRPIDYDAARDRFLIAVLTEGDHSVSASLRKVKCEEGWWYISNEAVDTVAALLTRRLAAEDVTEQLNAAAAAARAALRDAWAAEAAEARAAAWAARAAAAAWVAWAAEAAWAAAWAARAAAWAAEAALRDAWAAEAEEAMAATGGAGAYRTHLVNALINSRVEV
jgi:hypothetical protein